MLYSPAFRFPARKPTGTKLALKPFYVWGIRVRLQVGLRSRNLALFDLALDSKLRGCDLVQLKVADLVSASGGKRTPAKARKERMPSRLLVIRCGPLSGPFELTGTRGRL